MRNSKHFTDCHRAVTYGLSVRALVMLVALAFVLFVAFLILGGLAALARGRQPTLPTGGKWQPYHYTHDGHTVVAVARTTPDGHVVEKHVVARVPDADKDWSGDFLQAKMEAEERAFHLNADSTP